MQIKGDNTQARKLPKFRSQYLNDYLEMVEDTESPRLYHIWCALAAVGASLGRRCWLPFGTGNVMPNQFILLVGNPAVRKSTAMNLVKKLLKDSTHVRFAPQDTAGQRQGLVKCMLDEPAHIEAAEGVEAAIKDNTLLGMSADFIMKLDNSDSPDANIADLDKHHICVLASEFSRFIGQNNLQMLDFLVTMWDGDDYEYETKQSTVTMKNPLINLVGCTTPTSISTSLPAAAGGQGFLSRMILVYGASKYKAVPRPTPPPAEVVSRVKSVLTTVYHDMHGAFTETPEAFARSEELYAYSMDTSDSRFVYYRERRFTHLLKLAMIFAASRGSMEIDIDDYNDAHHLLVVTERGMPEALGQFGLSPLAQVKQGVLEFLRNVGEPVSLATVQAVFHRDAKAEDISQVVNDLTKAKLILSASKGDKSGTGSITLQAVHRHNEADESMMDMLAEQ